MFLLFDVVGIFDIMFALCDIFDMGKINIYACKLYYCLFVVFKVTFLA